MMVKVVEVSGSPRERGRQHGEVLREQVNTCFGVYQRVFGLSDDDLAAKAVRFEREIDRFSPDLAEELRGIAEGAKLPAFKIFAMNARSELMSDTTGETLNDGCTALFDGRSGFLAQTWDWMDALEDLVFALKVKGDKGPDILTITEPGMVGKIGFNSEGLGCTLNFVYSPGPHMGTPIHILLRALLECDGLSEAKALIERRLAGQSGNIIVGTAESQGFDAEFAGAGAIVKPVGNPAFYHTNHYLWHDIEDNDPALRENSLARLQTATDLGTSDAPLDQPHICQILSDRSHDEHHICTDFKPLFGATVGTVCTVVMDLKDLTMQFRRGHNPDAPFREVRL